jgi:hypothetical protein
VACRPYFFVDRRLVEAESRWVDGEWIRPSPGNFGVRHLSYSASRGISGRAVPGMACTVTGLYTHFGMGSKKWDLTLVVLPCWYRCSHGDKKWLAIALNALTFV